MRTVDSLGTSVTDSSLYGSLTDSATTADHKFEQIIDLAVTNAKYNTSDDLLNCNTNITFDNNQEEETLPKPIIAFEENATRRQEVAGMVIVNGIDHNFSIRNCLKNKQIKVSSFFMLRPFICYYKVCSLLLFEAIHSPTVFVVKISYSFNIGNHTKSTYFY